MTSTICGAAWTTLALDMESCCLKAEYMLCISVRLLKITIIVNSLTCSVFMLITKMLIAKLTSFLLYADLLACHFERFSSM